MEIFDMLDTLFVLLIGMYLGWNTSPPEWSKQLQRTVNNKLLDLITNFRKPDSNSSVKKQNLKTTH